MNIPFILKKKNKKLPSGPCLMSPFHPLFSFPVYLIHYFSGVV